MAFLIDTCIWIDIEQGVLAPADVASVTGSAPIYLSPITLAELKFGAEAAATDDLRQKRLASLQRLQRKPTLTVDGGTGLVFGSLAAAIRAQGHGHRYRVQDLWLASQAVQHGFRLLTRNRRDFEGIPGLDLIVL